MASGLQGAASVAAAAARGFQRVVAKRLAQEYAESIRKIAPADIAILIQRDISLLKILDQVGKDKFGSAENTVIKKLLQVEPEIIVEVLVGVHPPLEPVLNTPEAIAWFKRQQSLLRK